jgi:hypothetical protein
MVDAIPFSGAPTWRVLSAGVIWMLVYLAARFALDAGLVADPWETPVALLPLPTFMWFAWETARALRTADELQRRIHLEALALAFPATMMLLMTVGLLSTLPSDPIVVPVTKLWALLPPLYGVCVGIAYHRYD